MEKAEGFDRQRLSVVPRPLVDAALQRPVTRRLVVTDAGYFPRADHHGRRRPTGAPESIVIACASGTGWADVGDQRLTIGAGDVLVVPAGIPHSYGAKPDDPWTIRWCHVRGSDTTELLEALGADAGMLVLSLHHPERVAALLDDIVRALELGTSPARLIETSGLAWHLLTLLAVDRTQPRDGTPLERALRHLDEHVDVAIPVPELAALVGLSPSHLTVLCREATGGGVLAYHVTVKMAEARRLLDTTSASVAEVGRAIGMDDPFYFSRRFRATHGLSPTAYRAQHKG